MLGFENVPKGKRLKYFKDYYLVSTVVLIIIILMVVSIVKVMFFREKEDLNILIAAAQSDFSTEHYIEIEEKILENADIDFNGNGNEKLVLSDCIMSANQHNDGIESAEQDMAASLKLSAVLETSLCTIQIVDEDMYLLLMQEKLLESYENLSEFGLKGEGIIKIPLSETKINVDMKDPLFLTVRPKNASRIDPEIYKKHIEVVKQIVKN